MSFLKAIPEELAAAATQLATIGSSLTAENAGAAAPTTTIAPATADEVSALQAGIFATYGTLYQQLAAEAQAIQEQFVNTLGLSASTYGTTEAANASAASVGSGGPIDALTSLVNGMSTMLGGPVNSANGNPLSLSSNLANFISYQDGNWASAMSCLIGMAGGGLLPADASDAAGAAAGAADLAGTTGPAGSGVAGAGIGAMPVAAGLGQATMVGNKLSVPPSWVNTIPASNTAAAVNTVGWTTAAPPAGSGTFVPGMPGLTSAARNSTGFGAPRYGVKPIVMPRPTSV
ncbi:PPE family protein, SVP subgroup [Mycobacterium haemophilum]